MTGFRNTEKALLYALLSPSLKGEQDTGDFTSLLVRQEEMKTMPFGEVWNEYCLRCGVPEDGMWLDAVRDYEKNTLMKRN